MRALAPALAVLLLAGCGGGGDDDAAPRIAQVVPSDTTAYAEVDRSVAERLAQVESWPDGRVAAFAGPHGPGLVLAPDDEGAGRRFARHEDAEIVAGNVVLPGSPRLLEAVRRAAKGKALGDSAEYRAAAERAGDADGLLLATREALGGLARRTVTGVVRDEDEALVVDVEGLDRGEATVPDISTIPARAAIALASPDLGRELGAALRGSELVAELRRRFGVDLERTLEALGAGRVWFGDRENAGLDGVPEKPAVLLRQARALHRHERRAGKRLNVYLPTAAGRDDPFVQLFVEARGDDPAYSLEVDDELLDLDVGPEEGGRQLDDTRYYAEASRALGGDPSALLVAAPLGLDRLRRVRFVAARDAGPGRQRIVVAPR